MTRPIAKPANVSARPRRRQGSSALFRTALVLSLALTCVLSTPVVLAALRSMKSPLESAGQPDAGQAVVPGVAPGACMSFAPAGAHSAKTVFIDPGHGGLDPGVVGTTGARAILEKTVALSVAMRLSRLLRDDGYRVVLSRTTDTSVVKLGDGDSVNGAITASAVHRDLLARIACANAASAAVLVSIHFDAFDDPSVAGAETFYDAARTFAGANEKLATDLQSALVAGLGVTDRGVWTDDGVGTALTSEGNLYDHLVLLGPPAVGWVDAPTAMPGALVEPLFLTNVSDAKFAADPAGQQRIATALRNGVEKYLAG
ncbi:MAG TPA: N-acetylmuramoyl-L-alanine amidase [Candidatus Dormibacteraeota bacterium]|nr:N-acetylmuramoyl-L-alanine amidase [Candidatus Dormibacteraeota bacterium]